MRIMLGTLSGFAILLLGLALLPLPIPFGLILIAIGMIILLTVNPAVAAAVRNMRRRSPKFDAAFGKLERFMPQATRKRIQNDD